mgnify:CR=1 FL=1
MKFDKIKSYAKINLALNVIGKTYNLHNIESLISFVDLHDIIMIKKIKSKRHHISFNGRFSKSIPKKNTISSKLKKLEKKNFLKKNKFKKFFKKKK